MWTWTKTELMYRKEALIATAVMMLVVPLAIHILLAVVNLDRDVIADFLSLFLIFQLLPSISVTYSLRTDLREEMRGLLVLPRGIRLIDVAYGRILIITIYHIMELVIMMGTAHILNIHSIGISYGGVFVLWLFFYAALIEGLLVDHFVDTNSEYLKTALITMPIIVPAVIVLNKFMLRPVEEGALILGQISGPIWLISLIAVVLTFTVIEIELSRRGFLGKTMFADRGTRTN